MSKNPFRYFKTSREIIQLGVMIYVRFPLSLGSRFAMNASVWVDRFGTYFAHKIRRRRSESMRRIPKADFEKGNKMP